jgi:hypothetical protein
MKMHWIAGVAALSIVASPALASSDSKGKDHPMPLPSMGTDKAVHDMEGTGAPTFTDANGVRYDYRGDWTKGQYVDPERRVYEGQWNGTVTRNDAAPHGAYPAGAPYPVPPHAAAPYPVHGAHAGAGHYEAYERCLKSEGVAGGAIGAIIGGLAGNRIAGRGNRTEGSLIGAGLGALAGLGIEKSMKNCEKHLPPEPTHGAAHGYPGYGAYPYGYYYYPQPMVTYQMVPVTTTTVTEEVYYENVPVKRRAVRKWKPRPKAKPRCSCR